MIGRLSGAVFLLSSLFACGPLLDSQLSRAYAFQFDWSTLSWPAGSTGPQTFTNVDGSGVDVRLTYFDPSGVSVMGRPAVVGDAIALSSRANSVGADVLGMTYEFFRTGTTGPIGVELSNWDFLDIDWHPSPTVYWREQLEIQAVSATADPATLSFTRPTDSTVAIVDVGGGYQLVNSIQDNPPASATSNRARLASSTSVSSISFTSRNVYPGDVPLGSNTGEHSVFLGGFDFQPYCNVNSVFSDVVLPRIDFPNVVNIKGFALGMTFQELLLDFAVQSPPQECDICAARSEIGSLPVSLSLGPLEILAAHSTTTATVTLQHDGVVRWENLGFLVTGVAPVPVLYYDPPRTATVSLEMLGLSLVDPFETIVRQAEEYFHESLSDQMFGFLNDFLIIADPGETGILVTAPDGSVTGLTTQGTVVTQIAGSAYFETDAGPIVVLPLPLGGEYTTSVIGIDDGDFELVTMLVSDGVAVSTESFTGAISAGEAVHFSSNVDVAAGVLATMLHPTGDYNLDGTVNAADYTVWRDSLNQTGVGLVADGNHNSIVDAGDFTVWKAHFGELNGSGRQARNGSATVPEPAAHLWLLFGAVLAVERRKKEWRK